MPRQGKKDRLLAVSTRLFPEDVDTLKKRAEESGLPWQTELRMLVRRALKGERKEFHVVKEEVPK